MSATPLRDKLVQWEHDLFAAAWKSGKSYPVARTEVVLAVNQYEEQALARLALYPELVKALELGLEEAQHRMSDHDCHNDDCPDAMAAAKIKAVLAEAQAIEKEAKG